MATQLVESELKEAVREGTLIEKGLETCVEGLKYDFRLGNKILYGGSGPIDITKLPEEERQSKVLNPGELVYVLTEENLNLPRDIKAELSMKRKLSVSGILVLGGFGIDPGYHGRLLFALFNFSPEKFLLEPGRKLIAAQFYRLDESEIPPEKEITPILDFPSSIKRMMLEYSPASLEGIRQAFDEVVVKFNELKESFDSRDTWFKKFEESIDIQTEHLSKQGYEIDRITGNIDRLTEGLKEEREERNKGETSFRSQLVEVQKRTIQSATTIAMLSVIGLGIVIAAIIKIFGF